jgi:uncharacterized protein (TIGR03067 family)
MLAKVLLAVAVGVLIGRDDPPKGPPGPPGAGAGQKSELKLDDTARKEMEKFQGTWELASAERDGQAVPAEMVKAMRLVVKGDTRTVLADGREQMKSTFVVDPRPSPQAIDVIPADGPLRGRVLQGIYAVEGETIKISLALGGERPKEFTGREGHLLQVFKREKK